MTEKSAVHPDALAALREALEPFERKWLSNVRAWTYIEVRELLDVALNAEREPVERIERLRARLIRHHRDEHVTELTCPSCRAARLSEPS